MAKTRVFNDDATAIKVPFTSGMESGTLVEVAGLIGIVEGLRNPQAGDLVNVRIAGHAMLPKDAATSFTAGGDAQFNFGTERAVTSGGTTSSRVVTTPEVNATQVHVLLNQK